MSAPKTNLDKQADRHRGPLRGMLGVVLFALVLLAGLGLWVASRGNTPETGVSVDGRTGGIDSGDGLAPLVQPQETTGADASVGEMPDTNPSESQTSLPLGSEEADTAPSPVE